MVCGTQNILFLWGSNHTNLRGLAKVNGELNEVNNEHQ